MIVQLQEQFNHLSGRLKSNSQTLEESRLAAEIEQSLKAVGDQFLCLVDSMGVNVEQANFLNQDSVGEQMDQPYLSKSFPSSPCRCRTFNDRLARY